MTGTNKVSTLVAGIGLALLPAALFPAHAAPPANLAVQILDPSGACSDWTWGGTPSAPTITCVAAAPPTPGVPVCAIKANNSNPLTISVAGAVALSATCTNTDTSTTWAWTGTGASPTTPAGVTGTQSLNVSATTTFGVIATNATGPSVNKTVVVTVGAPPPPPPSGSIQCAGYDRTIVVDIPWQANYVVDSQGFDGTSVVVARFTVPAGAVTTSSGTISGTDSASSANFRYATLTSTPCDFSPVPGNELYNTRGPGSTVSFSYTIGGAQAFNKVLLQAGQTYYMNIRNTGTSGGNTCPVGTCEVHISFNKPKNS